MAPKSKVLTTRMPAPAARQVQRSAVSNQTTVSAWLAAGAQALTELDAACRAERCSRDEMLRRLRADLARKRNQTRSAAPAPTRRELNAQIRTELADPLADFERRDAEKIVDPEARARFIRSRLARHASRKK